jgi:YfiH family protein
MIDGDVRTMTHSAGPATVENDPTPFTTLDATLIHRSSLLSKIPGVVHGVTRRVSRLGLADGNVGYSAPRDRDDAWSMRQLWLRAAGLDAENIVVAYQMHGAAVAVVSAADAGTGADPNRRPIGQADALVTAECGVVPMTLHADCMAILLCDPVRKIVATVHAGWRGTIADVAGETVRCMGVHFDTDPGDVMAYLGPAIGACCYVVGEDVRDAWLTSDENLAAQALRPAADRWLFDLAAANRSLLDRAGVRRDCMEESGICTRCQGSEWFSHRGQGPDTGRYGAFIALTESRVSGNG